MYHMGREAVMREGTAVGTPRDARRPIWSASMRTGVKDLVTRAVESAL
jgi:hypothetical protein